MALNPQDWFLPAIQWDGGVDDCLGVVYKNLECRKEFIGCLRNSLAGLESDQDRASQLKTDLKELSDSLDFRLGVLSPTRIGAWFRPLVHQEKGPFPRTLLEEPVFLPFDSVQTALIKSQIATTWRNRRKNEISFKEKGPTLWGKLLNLNAEWESIARLDKPFDDLRLNELPEGLPDELESAALRRFLENVRDALIESREILDSNYEQLWSASLPFWEAKKKQVDSSSRSFSSSADGARSVTCFQSGVRSGRPGSSWSRNPPVDCLPRRARHSRGVLAA